MKRILCVVGTRPEAIKMAPLIKALQSDPFFEVKVVASGQHRELLQEVLDLFYIQPEIYFDVMKTNQQLVDLTARLLVKIKNIITPKRFDFVVAQGDTTTLLATALASFYAKTPFGHVEAGLRTNNLFEPYPEEMNRVLTSHLTALHFAPTEGDKRNLLKENIDESAVFVTGNTVIDALSYTIGLKNLPKLPFDLNQRKLILATIHRRESFGEPLLAICNALRHLAEANQNLFIYYPVHPNPNVHETVFKELKGIPNIFLSEAINYFSFVSALSHADLVLTDSGGVQEEAPFLGKPTLVLRNKTERIEGILAGSTKLIGTKTNDIIEEVNRVLKSQAIYQKMSQRSSVYGDGKASQKIVSIIKEYLS